MGIVDSSRYDVVAHQKINKFGSAILQLVIHVSQLTAALRNRLQLSRYPDSTANPMRPHKKKIDKGLISPT
jgi:hypothetical protein